MITPSRKKKIEDVLRNRQDDLVVVMENIWDPHNVSAVLRTCDAVGVKEVCLVYHSGQEFPKLGRKSSASAKKWLEFKKYRTIGSCYAALRKKGFKIYASFLDPTAKDLYDMNLTKKVALVFGNESEGVSPKARELADGVFYIPMKGMVQSLNVSVAAAVTLYEAFRQKNAKRHYAKKGLDTSLARKWMKK